MAQAWGLREVFGSKPTVPNWHALDFGKEQGSAIANNLANFPAAAELGNLTQEQILQMLRQVIPNWDSMSGQIGENIGSQLRGEIPGDVADQVHNSAAARSLGGGYAGSGMARNLVARDLGLTSLNMMDKGLSSAESWLAASERLMSPATSAMTSMFITPQQQASFDSSERDSKFAHDWLKNQVEAMPDPIARGIFDTNYAVGMMIGNMYGGKADTTAGPKMGRTQTPTSTIGQSGGGGQDPTDNQNLWNSGNWNSNWSDNVDWQAGYQNNSGPGVQGGYDFGGGGGGGGFDSGGGNYDFNSESMGNFGGYA